MTDGPVRLIVAGLPLLDAAVAGDAQVGRLLGCEVAEDWVVFPAALRQLRDAAAANPASAAWGPRLVVATTAPTTLVGWGGFKGPPADGVVEIGYSVAPAFRGRGLATAAAAALLDEAFADPRVDAVIAHTLPEPGPSVRVLEKLGFVRDGTGADADEGEVWRHRRARDD